MMNFSQAVTRGLLMAKKISESRKKHGFKKADHSVARMAAIAVLETEQVDPPKSLWAPLAEEIYQRM